MFARAVKLLAARPLSETEVRDRLLADSLARPDAVDACLSRLKQLGYLNDGRLAESYAGYRLSTKPMGRARIARELAGKKVSPTTIKGALDSIFETTDEEALIDLAIRKRIRAHGTPSDRRGAKRIIDHLARLGFPYDLILRKVRKLTAADGRQTWDDEVS